MRGPRLRVAFPKHKHTQKPWNSQLAHAWKGGDCSESGICVEPCVMSRTVSLVEWKLIGLHERVMMATLTVQVSWNSATALDTVHRPILYRLYPFRVERLLGLVEQISLPAHDNG